MFENIIRQKKKAPTFLFELIGECEYVCMCAYTYIYVYLSVLKYTVFKYTIYIKYMLIYIISKILHLKISYLWQLCFPVGL